MKFKRLNKNKFVIVVLSLSLMVVTCSTKKNGSEMPPIKSSGIQARVIGVSQSVQGTLRNQLVGITLRNNTKDTLYQLSGRLYLLNASKDTLALFTFKPTADGKHTLSTLTVNGNSFTEEEEICCNPQSGLITTLVYSYRHNEPFHPELDTLADTFTCSWINGID